MTTSVGAVIDSLVHNFSEQLTAYDELVALAERELAVLEDGAAPDALRHVLSEKERAIGRIDELTRESRLLREKSAADWGVSELNLSALEEAAAARGDVGATERDVGDVRSVVQKLAERMAALDAAERHVQRALLSMRNGVKDEMKRVHTGRDVLGAYRRAAQRPGESLFMDHKR